MISFHLHVGWWSHPQLLTVINVGYVKWVHVLLLSLYLSGFYWGHLTRMEWVGR